MTVRTAICCLIVAVQSTFGFAEGAWSLRTADTTLTVSASAGRLAINELSSDKQDWVKGESVIPLPDRVFVRGAKRDVRWNFDAKSGSEDEIVLRFLCEDPKLELRSVWTAHPGPGPIEHHFEILNHGGEDIQVPLILSLNLDLTPARDHLLDLWWVEKGGGRPSEAGTHRERIKDGYRYTGLSTPYANGPEMIPWLSIHDTSGSGLYLGIEFSGRVGFDVRASGAPLKLAIQAGLNPAEQDFRSNLEPGDRFITPTVFVGCFGGSVDDGANRLHRFVERHLRPVVSDKRYPLVVNNSWGSGMAVDEKLARHMIDDAASLGVELFHIDAGWFRSVGDWHPNPRKFPQGLAPVSRYARSKGMLFGLWVGWTQGGADARGMETLAVTNPKQRDWFTRDYPANWKPSDFTGAPVCLGSDDARQWCLNELRRIVKEYELDLLEHDQVMIVDQCARTDHGHTQSPGDVACHAARGYYSVYDQLRKENPKLLFEDCVNGGRTVDFGIVQRTHYISITDTYDPLSNRRAFYDSSYPLPPSMCECYIENKPGPTLATFKTMLRSGMMGWCTLMCDTGAWSREQHEAARKELATYKDWIRPLINAGNLYHISPRPDPARWDGMEYWDDTTGKGVLFAFRGEKSGDSKHAFKMAGLNPRAHYELWSEDGSLERGKFNGAKLVNEGVELNLQTPGASDLIFVRSR
jgi:alpha-galactosidase